jgi:DNA-binding CsgD family transcriptional regulator
VSHRVDKSMLYATDQRALGALLLFDKRQDLIAGEIGLTEGQMKYALHNVRQFYQNAPTTEAAIFRAHLCGHLGSHRREAPQRQLPKLTKRQIEVLWLVGVYGGPVIAAKTLDRSIDTMKISLRRIRRRLRANTTCVAIHRAFLFGLFDEHIAEAERRKNTESRPD